MGLLETMKQVAQATSDAGMPTAFLFGSVTKTSPLTIRVDNRFDISGDAIVVMKEFQAGFYPTHYHTGVKGSPSTEEKSGGSGDASFAAHSHTLKGNYQTNTDAKSEYYYGMAVGDKVVLLNALNVTIGEDVEVQTAAEAPTKTFKIDFDAGRVGGFCDETEAMKQAIYKILQTERFEYLIYSWNYGIELNAVVGKSFQVFASEIKRVIREALLADSRITDVTDFEVAQINKRTASVKFTAETIFGEIPIESEVNANV